MKKIQIYILIAGVIFINGLVLPNQVQAATINAASCNQSDVQNAINSSASGDTVQVPTGSCVWSVSVSITKPISIIGAGSSSSGTRLTSGATLNNGFFHITGFASLTDLVRISGFNFNNVNFAPLSSAILVSDGGISIEMLRIDHNEFHYGYEVVSANGSKGVIDHNIFYNPLKAIGFSAGTRAQADASWQVMAAGTKDALFIEDNKFIYDADYPTSHNYSQESIGTDNGGKLVVRFNEWDAKNYPNYLVDTIVPLMTHGSANGGCGANGYWQLGALCRRGQSVVEYYNNNIQGRRVDWLMIARGSSNLIHDNTITLSDGYAPSVLLREEEYANGGCENIASSWTPCRIAWPAEDQVHNTFIWNNSYVWKGNSGVPTITLVPDDPAPNEKIKKDRDYFLHAPLASGGYEYFTGANGASGTYPTDGTTYPTLGTMVFSPTGANAFYPYTPYSYPHPLVSGASPTPLAGDLNLDHIVNSIDYSQLNSKWFTTDTTADLNHDGLVNAIDFSMLNANWLRTW